MRLKKLLLFFMLISLLMTSCEKETESLGTRRIPILGELPVYYEALTDSSLIPKSELKGVRVTGCVINSKEELESLLGKKFLMTYPAYSKVNFENYTLVVRTCKQRDNIIGRRISFGKNYDTGHYLLFVDYVQERKDLYVYYAERTAIIVEKLDKNAIVDF